jgi:WD40 repeat protein
MDGNSVLSGGDDGLVKLWQVETGECVASLAGHDEGVTAVDFDISERNAISASADGTLKLWELASGACLHTFRGHRSRVDSFVASPDGNLILSRGNDQTVRFWELATGQSLGTIECHRLVQNLSSIWYVGYLADGRFVFGGSQYGVMDNDYHRYGLWDLASGDCLLDFYIDYSMGGDEVVGLEFSADGKLAISASEDQRGSRGNQNEMLNLWELASGEHLGRAGADYAGVAPVRITPDGRFAVSGSGYGRLKVWDTAEGDCLKTLEGHTGSIGSVDLSSDGKLLVSASADETLRLWVLDWELDHRKSADWDEGADYLRMFLERQRPYEIVLPSDRDATAAEISSALTRRGKPVWSDRDLSRLLGTLAGAGFGWLRPDRVRRRLAQMVTDAELLELCLKRLS